MIFIEADLRPLINVLGAARALEEDLSRPQNLATISQFTAETAMQSFAEFADAAAGRDAAALGHMYEWGELGEESGRLWRLIAGRVGLSTVATFDYKEAHNETPRGVATGDTRRSGHVFRWKAPITELGIATKQTPEEGGVLAIPRKQPLNYSGNAPKSAGTMWFSKQSVTTNPEAAARGAFTQLWMTHFSTTGIKVAEEVVVKQIDNYVSRYEELFREIPGPKVSRNPKKPLLKIESMLGHRLGRRKNGQFMNTLELQKQALEIQRIADGLA